MGYRLKVVYYMSKSQDEKTKITATFLNGIAISMVVSGGVAPLLASSYQVLGATGTGAIAFISGGWIATGFAVHLLARWILGGLDP